MYDMLFSRYGSAMGLCFDTGHALMACKDNCLEYAQRYADRLFMIHIHDNHGTSDEHLIPFEGNFDWEGFAPVLARSPYQFPILIESACRETGDDSLWLKKAFEAGCRFSSMVENCRRK
jgi:sugar phosphate isomerase/epimerase